MVDTLKAIEDNSETIDNFRNRITENSKKVLGLISISESNNEPNIGFMMINKDDRQNVSDNCRYGVTTPFGYRLKEVKPGIYIMIQDNRIN